MNMQYFQYGETEINHLRKKDKKLGAVIDQVGFIKRPVNPDVFSSLVESIVSQQISSKVAETVCLKLNNLYGMGAEQLTALTVEEIQSCGMSMRKAGYVKGVADAAVSKTIDFETLSEMSDSDVIKTLTALKGVGVWTAEMLLIFSLMRPNVISYGDLAIRRGITRLYGLKELPKDRFERYARRYSPYCSVASLYLWHISVPTDEKRKKA
jgi:3-methyladenine DNA glycosylase/8-oxoguanine DNA glycosylase